MEIQVEFFVTRNGRMPAKEFLESLEPKLRAKTVRTIMMLEKHGTALRSPYSKYVGDGLYELRSQAGNNISRELYFFFDGAKAILTNGFVKKTQKTPPAALSLAKKYKKEFEEREGRNHGKQ